MKTFLHQSLLSLTLTLLVGISAYGTSYTWTGTTSRAWNTTTNWNPNGLPDSVDNVTIVTTTNSPLLSQNRKVNTLTMTSGTLDLGGYKLVIKGTANFNGGTIQNGTVNPVGLLGHFAGTHFNSTVTAKCGYFHMNGGQFDLPVTLEDTGYASTSGTGASIFNDSLIITHRGTAYFNMATTTGDVFNGPVKLINYSTHEINIASFDSSTFNGNIEVNSTNNGGILFGNTGGKSVLASGKTISVGSIGFTNDYLTLKKFTQLGSTAQTLTLENTGIINIIDGKFNGNLIISAAGFLLKNNSFFGTARCTKHGSASFQSDGGNTFFGEVTIENNGNAGRLRMATVTGDNFKNNAFFNSTSQDLQIAYNGDNYFEGDITINSIKVVFNTSRGRVIFTGTNSQTLKGSYNFAFNKVTINKNSNHVTSNTTLSVDDSLKFTKGNIITTSTNLLTLKAGSKAISANDSSFVSGPVKKIGNTAFVFPTGSIFNYRPIEITAPSLITNEYVAEFKFDSVNVNTGNRDSTIGFIKRNQYWNLSRSSGTSQVYVTLSWNAQSLIDDTTLTIANWNDTKWIDLYKGTLTGTAISGTLKSSTIAPNYTQFALAYRAIANPGSAGCSNITTATGLKTCLNGAGIGTVLTVTSEIDLDGNSINFPLKVNWGVVLQGSTEWWKPGCPLITSSNKSSLSSAAPEKMFLFEMDDNSSIRNLRIRGGNCDFQDYNNDDMLCGGIYLKFIGSASTSLATVQNCELSCFSYAGIFGKSQTDGINSVNNYIHKVKGVATTGIGYGCWMQGDNILSTIDFENNIFDDCKTAIDGQGYADDWNINKCSFSQFFISEDINKHNNNSFRLSHLENGIILPDYHYCFTNGYNNCSNSTDFYGPFYSNTLLCEQDNAFTSVPTYTDTWINFSLNPNGIPIYDVGGASTHVLNSIFHKKWTLETFQNGNGNINLTFPNRDVSKFGDVNNEINISNNTFATKLYTPSEAILVDNLGGYAKIADNYIEACIWNGAEKITSAGNSFNYKPGLSLSSSTSPVPSEISVELEANGNVLNYSNTLAANADPNYIQYVDLGEEITIKLEIINPVNNTLEWFIVRPNPCENPSDNFYYDDQFYTDGNVSPKFTYNQPGLYGIDVIGFDAYTSGLNAYEFKSSAWKHIPVIVKHPTDEQILYFNINDSYKSSTSIDVYKEVYLNNVAIWSEKISDGGQGWQYVTVDLKGTIPSQTASIKSLIYTDGTPNVLSFGIFIPGNVDATVLRGLKVWIDDVYIKKSESITGDNLIKDGSIERTLIDGILCNGVSDDCYWFQDVSKNYCLLSTDAAINSVERKSGTYAIELTIPKIDCANYVPSSNGEVAISVGTVLDFTDLLSCNDYSDQGFIPFPNGPYLVDQNNPANSNPQPNRKYYIGQNIALSSGDYLKLAGCQVVIDPNIIITVNLLTSLEITNEGSSASHLFACSGMWQGIFNDGGVIKIMPSSAYPSIIEDAKLAILSDGGTVKIRFAEFDHNYQGITLSNGNFDYSSSTEGIFGIKFKCSDGVISRGPFTGKPSFTHIVLENVTGVEIGSPDGTSGSYKNEFSDASNAILSNNSSAVIHNNYFNNIIENNSWCPGCGVGVLINNSNNATRIIDIGGSADPLIHERNYFTNVNKGIYTNNVCHDCSLLIRGNSFNNDDFIYTSSSSFYNTAISIQNPFTTARVTPVVEVLENTISDYRMGIHAENVFGIRIGTNSFGDSYPNKIHFHLGASPTLPDHYIGILLQQCNNAIIRGSFEDPASTNNTADIDNDEPTIGGNALFKGIDIENSKNCRINCNYILNTPISIRFFGDNNGTLLRKNKMKEYDVAIWLDAAKLPPQFQLDPTNSSDPMEATNNEWHDVGESNRVDGSTQNGAAITWHYDNTNNTINYIPDPANFFVVTPEPDDASLVLCEDYSNRYGRDELYGNVVDDSLEFTENAEENRYLAKMNTFLSMKNDSNIIYQNTGRDSIYLAFYNQLRESNIALFDSVLNLAADTTYLNQAITLNSAIVDTNTLELYRKSANNVYLNTIAKNIPLDENDSILCDETSSLDFFIAGDAIYTMAAMIGKEIHPQTVSLRMGENHNNFQIPILPKLKYYGVLPNPTSGLFRIKGNINIIKTMSMIGSDNKILRYYTNSFETEISVNGISPGIYYLKIELIDSSSEFIKLIIIR